ncbi:MAG: PspC domain-containing protein [Crocinitomicaceae bacterium]
MKKTLSVNIKGINFVIEEDAYELLQDYLDRLEKSLKNEEGSQEIIEDVELRIAELSSSKLNDSKTVIELEDIKEILSALGNPEDFIDDTDEESTSSSTKHEQQTSNGPTDKRLYRDTDNAVIAGVCSGIASFFKIDIVFIRALFIVVFLFAGFGIPVYIIMWIIVPKAKTTIDRLRMRGKPITVESMREEVENAAERFKNGSAKFADKIRKGDGYSNTVSRGARFISVFCGLGFVFFGLIFLVIFIIFGIGSTEIIPVHGEYGFLSAAEFGELVLSNSSDFNLFWWGAFVGISSAILFALLVGSMLIFRLYNKWAKFSLLGLFLIGLTGGIICGIVGARTGRDFFSEGEGYRTVGSVKSLQLVVIPQLDEMSIKDGFQVNRDNDGFWEMNDKFIIMDHIKFKYIRSNDSLFHVRQYFSARSYSNKTAELKSENIRHNANLFGDSLLIDTKFKFPRKDKLRDQGVEVIIEIPENGKVKIGNQIIVLDQLNQEDGNYNNYRERGSMEGDGEYYHNDWD